MIWSEAPRRADEFEVQSWLSRGAQSNSLALFLQALIAQLQSR